MIDNQKNFLAGDKFGGGFMGKNDITLAFKEKNNLKVAGIT